MPHPSPARCPSKRPPGFPSFAIRPGDRVLYGTYGITSPKDWIPARVLWVDDEDCLIEHSDLSGHDTYKEVVPLTAIRAIGELADLVEWKRQTAKSFAAEQATYEAAQEAAEQTRRAMWGALDKIGGASADLRKAVADA